MVDSKSVPIVAPDSDSDSNPLTQAAMTQIESHPSFIKIQVKVKFADPELENAKHDSLSVDMNYICPPGELMEWLDGACKNIRYTVRSDPNLGRARNQTGGIETVAVMTNGDVRDQFLCSRDCFIRFETIGDMLRHGDPKTLTFKVTVKAADPIDPEESTVKAADTIDPEESTVRASSCTYHRVATVPVKLGAPRTQQQPMMWGIFQRYNHDNNYSHTVKILERKFSQVAIGSCDEASRFTTFGQASARGKDGEFVDPEIVDLPEDYRVARYKNLTLDQVADDLNDNLTDEKGHMFDVQEPGRPTLPKMTFQPYAGKLSLENMPKGETYLAVSIKGRPRSSKHAFPQVFVLPADVVVHTVEGTSKMAAIRHGLRQALYDFCHEDKNVPGLEETKRFFASELIDTWHFDLWIRPEKDKGAVKGAGTLYRMEKDDSVNMFLDCDASPLKKGKLPMMYMEAHMIS